MKGLPTISAARLALLGLAALLVFGNCSQNVYRVLGPGTTVAQVTRLRRLDDSVQAEFQALRGLPAGETNYATTRLADSAAARRRRILTPAQYGRYKYQILPLRYPRRPPRGYR
jgi:hypothetical protein